MSPNALGQNGTRTLAVNGTNFQSGATTTVSGTGVTVVSTTFVSSTKLSIKVKATATAPIGARDVTVTSGGGSATCTGCLTIRPGSGGDVDLTEQGRERRHPFRGHPRLELPGRSHGSASDPGITVNSTTFVNSGRLTAKHHDLLRHDDGSKDGEGDQPDKGTGLCVGCFAVT